MQQANLCTEVLDLYLFNQQGRSFLKKGDALDQSIEMTTAGSLNESNPASSQNLSKINLPSLSGFEWIYGYDMRDRVL